MDSITIDCARKVFRLNDGGTTTEKAVLKAVVVIPAPVVKAAMECDAEAAMVKRRT